MKAPFAFFLAALVSLATAASIPRQAPAISVSITPRDTYQTDVGVPACKINTNLVAYGQGPVDCNNICVEVSYQGRVLNLLNIGTPGGTYGVSYDAWNYLGYGMSAFMQPQPSAALQMNWKVVPNSSCFRNMVGGKLPLGPGAGSGLAQWCMQNQPNSFIATTHQIWNLSDTCTTGHDEPCDLPWGTNSPSCPHGAYSPDSTGIPFFNLKIGGAFAPG